MFEVLHAYLEKMFPITDEQFKLFQELFIPRELKKGELFNGKVI
jgi:hypothetical protein